MSRTGAITVARVDATSAWRRFAVAGLDAGGGAGSTESWDGSGGQTTGSVPGFADSATGPGWVRLADRLTDPAALDAWYRAELHGTAAGHRDLAGALIVYRFAGSLAELVVGPVFDQRRALVLRPEEMYLLLAADGARLDGVAVADPGVAVLPDDPDAAATDGDGDGVTVVADEAGLRAVAVAAMTATFGPLALAVRARAPFGLRGMWGTLADHLAEVALRRAREQGRPPAAAWEAVGALLDDLAAAEPLLRVRPRRQDVATPDGDELLAVKGTCCLVYKPSGSVAAAGCTSCPLRSDEDRAAGFRRYLAFLRSSGRG